MKPQRWSNQIFTSFRARRKSCQRIWCNGIFCDFDGSHENWAQLTSFVFFLLLAKRVIVAVTVCIHSPLINPTVRFERIPNPLIESTRFYMREALAESLWVTSQALQHIRQPVQLWSPKFIFFFLVVISPSTIFLVPMAIIGINLCDQCLVYTDMSHTVRQTAMSPIIANWDRVIT